MENSGKYEIVEIFSSIQWVEIISSNSQTDLRGALICPGSTTTGRGQA